MISWNEYIFTNNLQKERLEEVAKHIIYIGSYGRSRRHAHAIEVTDLKIALNS